ncbi:CoA binding domain protein [Aquimixticola soesokkakensis]|uniref:CoA binding domain protein n=1 Tax=Aquimixticola soesokkakensis TaxID=1519096 RepID=A0A1Y5SBR7_9RHOB|nr:CoA-binding protein [Aquimixticola soesokkakensis]SLN35555.1 CoA binding domain protein [Aquimixticola soesokkakensis]
MTNPSDADITRILNETRVIALVGASNKPARASFQVGTFLAKQGYKVIPVNPGQAGKQLFGQTVVSSLSDIDEAVDMVDVFRASEAVEEVVDEALAALDGLQTIWMQLGVENEAAAAKARAQGIEVVQDRCPKIEIPRLRVEKIR